MNINIKDYPYLYETHMHTNQGSQCGGNTGAEMVRAHKEAGYAGIIITDHHYGGNTAADRSLPWEDWCTSFFSGYRDAKQEGDKIGFPVFCGWEAGFHGTEFLVYGLTEEWMKKHPELKTCTVEEQYELVHNAGGMVIHAHPFRQRNYIPETRLFPDFVDGVEAINAAHNKPDSEKYGYSDEYEDNLANPRAFEYANKHGLPTTGGSDMHSIHLYNGTGTLFKKPLNSIKDYMDAILSHGETNDYILCDGRAYFTKTGEKIQDK